MSTNFPVSFDTLGAAGTLGGPFIDDAPPVDLFVDIAADFRSNSNDAMLAVQNRVGLTDSIDSGSLSWATISVGGVNNLGLRFAQDQSEWPGTVGESGIFLKDGTFEPMFHRGGEAKAAFYAIIGVGTLQTAYDVGNTIVTSGGRIFSISGTENFFWENSASNSFLIGSGTTPLTDPIGIVQVIHSVGVDQAATINSVTANLAGNNGWEFGAYRANITNQSDLDDLDIISAYQANLDMQGDGPGAGYSAGVAFHAKSASFTGANTHVNVGLLVEDTFDFWLISATGSAQINYGADTEKFLITTFNIAGGVTVSGGVFEWIAKMGDTNADFLKVTTILESTGDGGDQLGGTCVEYLTSSLISGSSNPLLAGGLLNTLKFDHRMDPTDDATAWHQGITFNILIPDSGSPGGVADVGSSAVGIIINVKESFSPSDSLYHNNDGTFSFNRWAIYVDEGESHLRRTEFIGRIDLGKALIRLDQGDADKPFYELEGRYDNAPAVPNCNFADNDTGGNVIGPKDGSWSWLGMFQVSVIDGAGHIAPGHYWVPLFQAL